MVQPLFPVDSPPPCTIQVQQIVTNLISTGGAPQAQCERCGGWPEFLSGWLLHTGAAGSCHLRTTSTQEARRHATRRRGRAGAIAARPGSCWSSSHPVQAKTQQKPTCVTASHEQPPTVVFQAVPDDAVDEAPGSHERLLPLPAARRGELMRLTLPVSRQFAGRCRSGMYALVCVPELSSWQWHPFTIASFDGIATASSFDGVAIASFDGVASGTAAATTTPSTNACASTTNAAIDAEARRHLVEPSPTPRVSFIVEVAGDWTALLVSACKQAHLGRGRNAMPRVVLDGPFPAPAQAAPRCPVLLAVGAGIGITPFLSLIETLAERELAAAAGHLSSELLEARCYWISRSAEAFLFGWPLLRKLLANAQLRTRIVFHLHVTARAPEGDGAAFLFREAVARQNARLPKDGCPEARADEFFVAVDDVAGGGGEGETAPAGVRIQFGRPDFQSQLLTLAARHPTYDVNVFACGGEALVESLAAACEASERAMRDSTQQRFPLAHERFG